MQIFRVILFAAVTVLALVSAQPGSAQNVDIHDKDVIIAARFAIDKAYNDQAQDYKVIRATRQIVNGSKFELTIEINQPGQACVVRQFGVWNRAGPPGQFLVENEILNVPCGGSV